MASRCATTVVVGRNEQIVDDLDKLERIVRQVRVHERADLSRDRSHLHARALAGASVRASPIPPSPATAVMSAKRNEAEEAAQNRVVRGSCGRPLDHAMSGRPELAQRRWI